MMSPQLKRTHYQFFQFPSDSHHAKSAFSVLAGNLFKKRQIPVTNKFRMVFWY